jgi:predicted Fe-Mo cluster-binding NifX family protein
MNKRAAIPANDGNGLDSVASPHFGRCPYYVLVDLDGREVSQVNAVRNPAQLEVGREPRVRTVSEVFGGERCSKS